MVSPATVFADLPIEPLLPELRATLARSPSLVLQAPPGAGKTTRVPLALLGETWLGDRRVVMLEPRRLAARAAAKRMADTLGERVGQTVGYRVRLDSAISAKTRIEVVTAGVFLRQIQDDPALEGVGAVLFDEFHERSLDVDLSLALCLDARRALREDLRLVAMSATLEGGPIAQLLAPGGAPILTSEGKRYPVETRYLARDPVTRLDETVAAAIRRALGESDGDLLVFLPGVGDIRRVLGRLEEHAAGDIDLAPLYSDLPLDKQDAAIRPSPVGRRKIVLATSIAETSLTIEGVRVVIDGGYSRLPRFDPRTGMSSLETVRVSRASADQRRGRAGRLGPGICYRLWTEAADRALIPQTPPEILDADLAPLALELAAWGATDARELAWLDPPPEAALAAARSVLRQLGAIDERGAIADEGRRMVKLGIHPRLAHMLLRGRDLGLGALAADLAALLGERDILRNGARDADLRHRVDLLRARASGAQPVAQVAAHWRRQLGVSGTHDRADESEQVGRLVALAYPDRVAQRRPETRGQFRLSNGRGATLFETDPLAGRDFLAVAAVDGGGPAARIFLAAPLEERELRTSFAAQIREVEIVGWDSREQAVRARRQKRFGELVLDDAPLDVPAERAAAAMIEGIRELGLAALPWTKELRILQARVAFLRRLDGDSWPDLSDEALLKSLETWLAPYLAGITRRAHLERLDLAGAVRSQLRWDQLQALDREAPTHITVPSGSRIPIDYSSEIPVLAVRLQEMFGLTQTPAVANGRVPLLLHLLSPAGRPVQVTRDLASFWAGAYREVKRDLKGQYPKHHWPDNPLEAIPTRRAKRRGE